MKREIILKKIIEEQQKVIDNLKQTVERYKTASDIDEDDTMDPEDLSQQTQAKDMQLRYEKMLNAAKTELAFLEDEIANPHDKIEDGALIETNKNWLFVGISVPVFKVEEKDVISFSDDAPIFKHIVGKNVGDPIQIGNNQFEIKSIT